jgi:hypothetical protein
MVQEIDQRKEMVSEKRESEIEILEEGKGQGDRSFQREENLRLKYRKV